MKPDLRSPLAIARDEYLKSTEGLTASNPVTLGAPPDQLKFLKNRIESAFLAGVKWGQSNQPEPVLEWSKDTDDSGNIFWEATSPYGDGAEGEPLDPFYFRIRQRLVDNKIEFYEASDAEAMKNGDEPTTWETIEAAKAQFEKWNAEIIESEAQ